MRLSRITILLACFVTAAACGQGRSRAFQPQSDDAHEAQEPMAAKTQMATGDQAVNASFVSLFKDEADFAPADLANGFVACAGIESLTTAEGSAIPWPPHMRSYLAGELAKFPDSQLVLSSVSGIYLARAELLTGKERQTRVGGITCQNRKTAKSVIFLNEDEFVSRPKMRIKVGAWYETENLVHNAVLENHGDQTLYTLIHELFHAIDLVHFISGNDGSKKAGRDRITDLAWTNLTTSKFEPTGILAMTAARPNAALREPITPESLRKHFVFSLHDAPEGLAADYTKLATQTNFITPYSSTNAIEDFADTLATYYFGTRYNSWMVRSVFDADLTNTPVSQAGLLYVFDTKQIMHDSEPHKDKACRMAELVFGENCYNYLQLPGGEN